MRELSDKLICALKSEGHRDSVGYLLMGERLAGAAPDEDRGKKVTVGTALLQQGSNGLLLSYRCPSVILPALRRKEDQTVGEQLYGQRK